MTSLGAYLLIVWVGGRSAAMARRNRKAALSPKTIVLAKAETSPLLKPESPDRVRAVLAGGALTDPRLEAERQAFLGSPEAQPGGFVGETVSDELRFLSAQEAENFERYRRDPVAFAKAVLGDRDARPWQSLVTQVPPKLDWSDEVFMDGRKTVRARERYSVKVPLSDPATWVRPRTEPDVERLAGRPAGLTIVDEVAEPATVTIEGEAGEKLELTLRSLSASEYRKVMGGRDLARRAVLNVEVERENDAQTERFLEEYEKLVLADLGSPDRTDALALAFAGKQENEAVMRDTRLIEGAGTEWVPVAGYTPGTVPAADGSGPRVVREIRDGDPACPRCGTTSQVTARLEEDRPVIERDAFQPFKAVTRDRGPTLYYFECGFCGYGERGVAISVNNATGGVKLRAEVKMVRGLKSGELLPGDTAGGTLVPSSMENEIRSITDAAKALDDRLEKALGMPDEVPASSRLQRDDMGNLILPTSRGTVAAAAGSVVSRRYGREQGCPSCGARPDRVNTTGREDRQRQRYALVCGACSYTEKGEVIVWNKDTMTVSITAASSGPLCPTEGCNARLAREVRFSASMLVCPLCRWEMSEAEYGRTVRAGGVLPGVSAQDRELRRARPTRASSSACCFSSVSRRRRRTSAGKWSRTRSRAKRSHAGVRSARPRRECR